MPFPKPTLFTGADSSLELCDAIAQLGGCYHTPHGLANAIVLPHILDFSRDAVVPR